MTDDTFDPRDGQPVLALWDFTYEFGGDIGGFAPGQFLLRGDGELWYRTGGGSGDGTYRFSDWSRWTLEPGPFDPASAYDAATAHHYELHLPGPAPVDVREADGLPVRDRAIPLRRDHAARHTAPLAPDRD